MGNKKFEIEKNSFIKFDWINSKNLNNKNNGKMRDKISDIKIWDKANIIY